MISQDAKKPSLFKPEPRDFKQEFADYLEQNALNQQEFAALLMTAKTMVFERDKSELLGMAINHTPIGKDDYEPRMLHRLRRHDIL